MQILRSFCHKFPEKTMNFWKRGGGGSFPIQQISLQNFWISGKKCNIIFRFPLRNFRKLFGKILSMEVGGDGYPFNGKFPSLGLLNSLLSTSSESTTLWC